ncbi:IgA peptidase M64-domain-containing protein [Mycena rebaudengoi]|nr:IgA peptidase M64-domain-containing protein [Mycena rebaudengoi]
MLFCALLGFLAAFTPAHAHISRKCLQDNSVQETTGEFEFLGKDDAQAHFKENEAVPPPPLEIAPLIVSGPSDNRVDLVFFSDGYLPEEKVKFIEDATWLAAAISSNQTYNTVKPLLNFWAAFTPSKESGVGVSGKPKDTAFGLYRPGTELRGVYYSKPQAARAACSSMGDQCDYPILLGNDPLYGGLGGRFTVITPSIANGALILRHELGHSIIGAGDEYDGADRYSGVNVHTDPSSPPPWKHWLTDPDNMRVERVSMPIQDYAWTMLNTSAPWSVTFQSSGEFARHLVRYSISGVSDKGDIKVELDGVDLGWEPRTGINLDRWHYDLYRDEALSGGNHTLKFTLLNGDRMGTAQLCNAEILEYGNEDEFAAKPGHYSLYPVYSIKNETSYRPTNEDCLMRLVTTPNFCKVCLEGLWLSLLRKISLVDSIEEASVQLDAGKCTKSLDLRLAPLAHLRADPVAGLEESYTITWFRDGQRLEKWANKTHVELEEGTATYAVEVKYSTTEVRVDPESLLTAHAEHTVFLGC